MRVCVIGAGVVGVTSAYFLARQGHDVVLVDSQPRPAEVSSYANGGQLSYSYVAPLAGPGVLPSVPGWLLRSDSPLRFRPRLDPHQWRWCLQFALACRASVARASTAELLTLSYLSRDAMHALLAQENLDFGHLKNGKLIAYRSAELLDKRARWSPTRPRMAPTSRCWTPPRPWRWSRPWPAWAPAWRARSIRPAKRRAIAASSPRHCSTACRAWPTCNARCPIRSRACSGKAAASWRCRAATATSARTRWCWRPASARARCSPLGHDVPLYPLKGYSLTVPLADDDHMAPAISVTDYERRIVYARVGGVLRIAAMVDIGGGDAQIDPERIALLKRQVHEAFPGLDLRQAIPWAGLRPATPRASR